MATTLSGFKSLSNEELTLLLTNPNALLDKKPKLASQLMGLDVQGRKRMLDLLAAKKLPKTDLELNTRLTQAMEAMLKRRALTL